MDISTIARELLDKVLQETVAGFHQDDKYRLTLTDRGDLHLECLEAGMEITYKKEKLIEESEAMVGCFFDGWDERNNKARDILWGPFEVGLKHGVRALIEERVVEMRLIETSRNRVTLTATQIAFTITKLALNLNQAKFPQIGIVMFPLELSPALEETIKSAIDQTFEKTAIEKEHHFKRVQSIVRLTKEKWVWDIYDHLYEHVRAIKTVYRKNKNSNWRELVKAEYPSFPDRLLDQIVSKDKKSRESAPITRLWTAHVCGITLKSRDSLAKEFRQIMKMRKNRPGSVTKKKTIF